MFLIANISVLVQEINTKHAEENINARLSETPELKRERGLKMI